MDYDKYSLLDPHRLRRNINEDAGSEIVDHYGELDPAREQRQVLLANVAIPLDRYSVLDRERTARQIDETGFGGGDPSPESQWRFDSMFVKFDSISATFDGDS